MVYFRCAAFLADKVTTRCARGEVAGAEQLTVHLFANSVLNRSTHVTSRKDGNF